MSSDPRNAIMAAGHGDLLEDHNGNWWMVHLGIRYRGLFNLGRETFLAPVVWDEDGWPVVGNNRCTETVMDGPLPGPQPTPVCRDFADDFDGDTLNRNWNFIRNPARERYSLENSRVILKGNETTLSTITTHPTMIVIRQPEHNMEALTSMEGDIREGQRSGLAAYYNEMAHYEIFVTKKSDGYYVCLGKRIYDIEIVAESHKIDYTGRIELKLDMSDCSWCVFSYAVNGEWTVLGKGLSKPLCTETMPCDAFTGACIGLFSENGTAAFDSFAIKCL
jgi:alpha-N-arabinofuranosidase